MFKKIGVENFKAFGEYQEINLNNLTIVSGLNSSGKSSLYQSILLLAQSDGKFNLDKKNNRIPTLEINGDLVKLGRNEDILHDKNINHIKLMLEWDDKTKIIYKYELSQANASTISSVKSKNEFILSQYTLITDGELELSIKKNSKFWEIEAFEILGFADFEIFEIISSYINNKVKISTDVMLDDDEELNITSDIFLSRSIFDKVRSVDFIKGTMLSFVIDFEDIYQCVNPIYHSYIDWNEIRIKFKEKKINDNNIIVLNNNRAKQLRYNLSKINILSLPPFRGYPRRVYTSDTDENPLSLLNSSLSKKIYYRYDFENNCKIKGTTEEAINYWLVDNLKVAEKIEVNEIIPGLISEIFLTIAGEKIAINNVGFGASQIVPVVFKVIVASKYKICIVDEPEIHLHASIQSRLADFFFEMALIGKQIFIETHSEYLIDKLIFLSLKYEKKKNCLSMHWIKKIGKESSVVPMVFDDMGYILNQPEDFLAEKVNLVKQLTDMRLKRI